MDLYATLNEYGVGRRTADDDFFAGNRILAEMADTIGVYEIDVDAATASDDLACQVPGCRSRFSNVHQQKMHYEAAHRFSCCECKKVLPTPHYLNLHVAESHDSFFAVMSERSPSYLCYVETCDIKFQDAKSRLSHCVKDHKFPPNFRFDQGVHSSKGKNKGKKREENEKMAVDETSVSSRSGNTSVEDVIPQLKSLSFGRAIGKTFHGANYFASKKNAQAE